MVTLYTLPLIHILILKLRLRRSLCVCGMVPIMKLRTIGPGPPLTYHLGVFYSFRIQAIVRFYGSFTTILKC